MNRLRLPSTDRRDHLFAPVIDALTRRQFIQRSALAAAAMPALASAQGTVAALRPYLQSVTADSIWVGWRTDSGTETVVEYGTSLEVLDRSVTGTNQVLGTAYNWHAASLTGLQPDSFYWYRVRTGTQVSDPARFRTLPVRGTNTGRLRFFVLGDNQILNEPRYETIVGRAKAKINSLYGPTIEDSICMTLHVGDQVDVGTLQHYQYVHLAKVAEISNNVAAMTLVGNHETYSDTGMARYKAHFQYDHLSYAGITSPGGDLYYANHVASILFIHLNSEDTSATQTTWVSQIVTAAKNDSAVEWIVSLVHRPYQAEQYVGDISSWFRNTIAPILAQTTKHVLNIGAHHHIYARGQMREWPVYHIISGGTAWDQFWGQSTEQDLDDVDKTIANWAWQVLDFDLTNKRMTVDCYAEAHPKLGFVYPSKKIDSFHRQFGKPAPAQPSLVNQAGDAFELPFTLQSTPLVTTAEGETLLSTQFQIASDSAFSNLKVDRIRSVENFYGDTGAPLYTPVDTHAGVDLLQYTISGQGLPNGVYYARVRHRDTNCLWSAWSGSIAFEIEGSVAGSPLLTLNKRIYPYQEDITVVFENAPGKTTDWIGIYKKGQSPGSATPSTTWNYLNGTRSAPGQPIFSGTLKFTTDLAEKQEWYAAFLTNDGYTEVAPRVPFYVGSIPVLTVAQAAYDSGQSVTVTFANAPAASKDWIAIYRAGDQPGPTPSTQYKYVNGAASGTMTFANLPDGFWFAVYLSADLYFELSQRVAFSVGDEIATVQLVEGSSLAYGSTMTVSFAKGAGTPKDYIGLFVRGATPGVDRLVTYQYVGGRVGGTVVIPDNLPAGDYYLALFINDSYTSISNVYNFTITGGPAFPQLDGFRSGTNGNMVMGVKVQPGVMHRLERTTNMKDWDLVEAFRGEGLRMDITVPPLPGEPRCFYRVTTL